MNIAIFGASGATGTLLTQRCLAASYNVRALLRNQFDGGHGGSSLFRPGDGSWEFYEPVPI